MIQDLKLLPKTKIVARSGESYAQITISNDTRNIDAELEAKVGGVSFGPFTRTMAAGTNRVAKATLLGGLLDQGLKHLGPNAADHPNGLPIEVTVINGARQETRRFFLPLNLNSLGKFKQIIAMVRDVNKRVGG